MYEELVKRLREIVPWECFLTCKNTMHEAADVIEGLSNLVDHYGGETGIKNLKEYAIKYWEIVKKEKLSEPYEELIKQLREAPNDWYDADLHYRAADAIEELLDRIAASGATIKRQSHIIQAKDRDLQRAIDAKPQWISVTEKLPEKDIEVLVFAEGKIEGFFGDTVIAISKRYDFKIFTNSEGVEVWQSPWQYFLTDYDITHWMPLPKPPKEET